MPKILQDLLKMGWETGAQGAQAATANQAKMNQIQAEHNLSQQQSQAQFQAAKDYVEENRKLGRKMGVSLGPTGGVSLSEQDTDPNLKMAGLLGTQASKLNATAQKQIGPITSQLDNIKFLHTLLDNPTAINQKNIQANLARMYEGPGARLLSSVINSAGGKPSGFQSAQDATNWFTGQANSGFTNDQINKMREELFSQADRLKESHGNAMNQLSTIAPSIAPIMASQGTLKPALDSFAAPANNYFQDLDQRKANYLQQAGNKTGLAPGAKPPEYRPGGFTNNLKSYLTGQGVQPQQPSAMSPEDSAAVEWLKSNPSHPAAAGVQQKLKSKGISF